jgi:hypothetical protein
MSIYVLNSAYSGTAEDSAQATEKIAGISDDAGTSTYNLGLSRSRKPRLLSTLVWGLSGRTRAFCSCAVSALDPLNHHPRGHLNRQPISEWEGVSRGAHGPYQVPCSANLLDLRP